MNRKGRSWRVATPLNNENQAARPRPRGQVLRRRLPARTRAHHF